MLCRCARTAVRRCAGSSATPSNKISGPLHLRVRPSVPCVSVMTNSNPSSERRVPFPPEANRVAPRANMSAIAEETDEKEHEEDGFAAPVLPVELRALNEQGSAGARRCRRDGYTPGVVYASADGDTGRGDRLIVKVNTKFVNREIRRLESSFENMVYKLAIDEQGAGERQNGSVTAPEEQPASSASSLPADGAQEEATSATRGLVLVKQVRLHPVRNTLMSMNLIRYKAGRRHPVPIRYVNEDLNVNIKKGAIILRLRTHQYIILPENPAEVPQWLDLDLEHVQSGDKLRVRDIALPPGLSLFRGNEHQIWDEVICTVKGKKVAGAKTEDGTEEDDEDE